MNYILVNKFIEISKVEQLKELYGRTEFNHLRFRVDFAAMVNGILDDEPLPTTDEVKRVLALGGIFSADLENYRAIEGFPLSHLTGNEIEEAAFRFGVLTGQLEPRTPRMSHEVASKRVRALLEGKVAGSGNTILEAIAEEICESEFSDKTLTVEAARATTLISTGKMLVTPFQFFDTLYCDMTEEHFEEYLKLLDELFTVK